MWGAIKKAINSNLNKSLDVLIQEKATETNSKVDSKANQTSVDSINGKTGATADTGGTASAGSIFAKLNKLLTDWTTTRAGCLDTTISSRQASWGATTTHRDRIDTTISSRASQETVNNINANIGTLINGRVVKSVQRGVASSASFRSGTTATIEHNSVSLDKSIILISGPLSRSGGVVSTWIASRNSNSFTLAIIQTPDNTASVSWELIEFY